MKFIYHTRSRLRSIKLPASHANRKRRICDRIREIIQVYCVIGYNGSSSGIMIVEVDMLLNIYLIIGVDIA